MSIIGESESLPVAFGEPCGKVLTSKLNLVFFGVVAFDILIVGYSFNRIM